MLRWRVTEMSGGSSSRWKPRGTSRANSQARLTWAFDWGQVLFARWSGERSSEVTDDPCQVAGSHFCRRSWRVWGRAQVARKRLAETVTLRNTQDMPLVELCCVSDPMR